MSSSNLRLSLSPMRGTAQAAHTPPRHDVPVPVVAAVLHRDLHVCHYCGFRSPRYQTVVVLGPSSRDIDAMKTACQFCHQCLHLGEVKEMRSGVLIWLPELSQQDLHHAAREIYIARITRHAQERGRRALDHLMSRREAARERLGTDDPKVLCERLASAQGHGVDVIEAQLNQGIRLLPLDRRILRMDDLEFNQFPQVLAHWRSKDGPYSGEREFAWIGAVERVFESGGALESVAPSDSEAEAKPNPTPVNLAAQLLRDAAHFFTNVAEQNPESPDVASAMNDNAAVYRYIAGRLDTDPNGELAVPQGTPLPDAKVTTAAARLLEDSAAFFENLGRENKPLQEQMESNASVYRDVAALLREAPFKPLFPDD